MTFYQEPFLGYIPNVTGKGGYGHSSLSNSLVIFGIFGAGLWAVSIGSAFSRCYRIADLSIERYAIAISGITLFLSGVLNPIWHSPTALCAVFSLLFSPAHDSDENGV